MSEPFRLHEPATVEVTVRRRLGEYEHIEMRARSEVPAGSLGADVQRTRTLLALALDPSLAPPAAQEPSEERKAPEAPAEPVASPAAPETPQEVVEPEAPAELTEEERRAWLKELFTEAAAAVGHEKLLATVRPIFEKHGVIDGGTPAIEGVDEAIGAINELLGR